ADDSRRTVQYVPQVLHILHVRHYAPQDTGTLARLWTVLAHRHYPEVDDVEGLAAGVELGADGALESAPVLVRGRTVRHAVDGEVVNRAVAWVYSHDAE